MATFPDPTVAWLSTDEDHRPLVVLLHGRGADEASILGLARHLPPGLSYCAVRAPIAAGAGYAWFANRGVGRPIAESLADTTRWFRAWLDALAPAGRSVVLVGFSGGAAFAGGVMLSEPARFSGGAILYGTLPFDAGVPTTSDRLAGIAVMVAQGDDDHVIPRELLDRTWRYIEGESGAKATMLRSSGGHELSPAVITALHDWVAATAGADPSGTS
jgi:phospholipase/carboxylesterase